MGLRSGRLVLEERGWIRAAFVGNPRILVTPLGQCTVCGLVGGRLGARWVCFACCVISAATPYPWYWGWAPCPRLGREITQLQQSKHSARPPNLTRSQTPALSRWATSFRRWLGGVPLPYRTSCAEPGFVLSSGTPGVCILLGPVLPQPQPRCWARPPFHRAPPGLCHFPTVGRRGRG